MNIDSPKFENFRSLQYFKLLLIPVCLPEQLSILYVKEEYLKMFNCSITVCIKKMATRIITAYNSANSYQIIIILISQETLFFCLSNDVFFVEIEKVEEEEIEKKDSEKLIIFLTIN